MLKNKDLLGIRELSKNEILYIIDNAKKYYHNNKITTKKKVLNNFTQINLFFENSTRTQVSFEIAGTLLGASVVNFPINNSSQSKGETLIDLAATLNSMTPDILLTRKYGDTAGLGLNYVDEASSATFPGIKQVFQEYQMKTFRAKTKKEKIALPSLYFSHEREVIRRGDTILANSPFISLKPNEKVTKEIVRFRTIGDLTITGAVESEASTLDHIIAEVAAARETERGNRADDQRSEAAMEERKKEGYF